MCFINYYNEIKKKLIDNEIYIKVKDYSKERYKVITYFEIGKLLYEAGSIYGENIIGKYAERLMNEVGKKYTRSTLFRMKQLYTTFSNEKVAPLVRQLTWSHCLILLPIKDINKIDYYIKQIKIRNLSKRQLEIIVKSNEYERLDKKTKLKLITNEEISISDNIKKPIIIKNKYDTNEISEKVLKELILEDLPNFMKELGIGYCFIDSEYKIKIGNNFNYIDLLLFNIEYNCYAVIELKVTSLKKEHIGQIEIYMNYIDENVKKEHHNKTIGIIVTRIDNRYIILYRSNKRIINTTYKLI